ncbi:SRPRA [Symbiodinium natans]|uniref:SRPRA protein n=1 Tax=Symbiodinium natans TaxID=878477 RepID=A0A812P1R1_9DINO|nr:SRPRA [Symbiodinium natans]
MIDAFYIFTKGGLLLWSTQLVKVKGNPLDRLIKEVLLEERVGETFANIDAYNLKWKLLNEMDIFFVVVYQGILQMAYLEGLLAMVAKEFVQHVGNSFGNGLTIKHVDFDQDFLRCRQRADKDLKEARRQGGMRSFADTKKGAEVQKTREEKGLPATSSKKGKSGGADDKDEDDEDDADASKVAEARGKLGAKSKAKKEADPATAEKPKKGKEARHWDGGKVSKSLMQELDFSKNKPDDDADLAAKQAEFLGSGDENFDAEVESLSSGSEDEAKDTGEQEQEQGRVGGLFKSLTRGVKNLTGGAVLGEEDLEPILKKFKTELMTRNVAAEVADKLSDSVRRSLVGKTTGRFTTMASTVKQALKESMETLLTPKKSIDVLRAALAAKNAGRVYTIVFLGVNGVGKSTNLAKVAYYLKHKGGLNVLICACDTFRAGAVEQLKTHSRCLDVPLFERGYGKDPADIAKNAIAHAKSNGHDVVLVDTAGRMQDNEPLMRALAKLVAINTPDLVLFVGEALVGNDAIDQVTKFNRSLVDLSADPRNPRGIDGMLLTKYDTVDDKVGAALSMVYVTGQPVVFVGTGQKYTHLRKMQAKEVVRTLLG